MEMQSLLIIFSAFPTNQSNALFDELFSKLEVMLHSSFELDECCLSKHNYLVMQAVKETGQSARQLDRNKGEVSRGELTDLSLKSLNPDGVETGGWALRQRNG